MANKVKYNLGCNSPIISYINMGNDIMCYFFENQQANSFF